ncbi:MAG TPA: EAL domain-containing protein [Rhodopila sp.]|nr:EAL domain-containing protein [Rhodopila sp.]
MLRVVGQIIADRAPGFAGLACLVCFLAASTAIRLLARHPHDDGRQNALRLTGAVFAFGAGTWATHFIGLMAFHTGIPFGFDVNLCALSLGLVLATTAIGFAPGAHDRPSIVVLKGLVLTAGIAAMHVTGMRALLLPGRLYYQPADVAASVSLGLVLVTTALWLLRHGPPLLAAAALTLGTLSVDLLGMASVRLALTPGLPVPPGAIPHPVLVATTSGACLAILLLALGASVLDQHQTRRLATEARRFRALADATFEGLVLEHSGRITDANLAMGELTGLAPEALVGRTLAEVLPDLVLCAPRHRQTTETAIPQPDGADRPVEVLWRDNPDSGGHVIAIRDLSRQRAAESLIDRLARLDPLTGLLNREAFEHDVQALLDQPGRRPAGIALLHLTIDRLDMVAELIGPAATEPLLIQVAQRLKGSIRQYDLLGRLGRDEFAVLQTVAAAPVDPTPLAERILGEMGQPFTVGDPPIGINVSIGVAVHPADGTSARDLMRNAAMASALARQDGRNRCRTFDSGLGEQLRERQMLRRDLRVALKQGQFTLHYQPIVDAESMDIAGYEALLRWDHPERGRIPPSDFIPVAEESGLIVPIGSWVLATACAEAASWDRPLTVAVNLSPVQFEQPGIIATITEVLRRTGLPAERLELEVTETTLIEDKHNALEILTALKGLGVKLAMDDFGTGYSSLSYLRTYPFDKIKIDRSFVRDVERDAEAETIVQAIIVMGMSLRLKITAEGVETKQQLAMLRAYGCTFLQGYLLGRPCGAAQIQGRAQSLPRIVGETASSIADALPMLAAAAHPA